MSTKRIWPGVAALHDKIYVAGGKLGENSEDLRSVECYDLDTNNWTEVASMNFARAGYSLLSLRGRLYAMGGDGDDDEDVGSVEVYDPENNSWTVLQDKIEGINGACTIKKYFVH